MVVVDGSRSQKRCHVGREEDRDEGMERMCRDEQMGALGYHGSFPYGMAVVRPPPWAVLVPRGGQHYQRHAVVGTLVSLLLTVQ